MLSIHRYEELAALHATCKHGEGITSQVAATGRPMSVANLGQETHFPDRTGARCHLNRAKLSFTRSPKWALIRNFFGSRVKKAMRRKEKQLFA